MDNNKWVIETHGLTRIYGDVNPIYALNNVNLCVRPGELLAIMGPSGSGKSTLLNMIGALDLPTNGQVLVNGQDVATLKDKDSFRASTVGFIFQLHNLIPTLSARENVEVPMMGRMGRGERHKRSEELLRLVGLGDRLDHLPGQLSGGQRQRVAVARALANNPSLVLADEPTGSLDTASGQELLDLIRTLNSTQGTTFVIVTHDPSVARQTSRVVVMRDGAIAREDIIGSPYEEDLKMWRHSALGQQIVESDSLMVNGFSLPPEDIHALRRVLSTVEDQ